MVDAWSVPDFESKICPPEALAARLALLPRPLVFTNGCFDILHRGTLLIWRRRVRQGRRWCWR